MPPSTNVAPAWDAPRADPSPPGPGSVAAWNGPQREAEAAYQRGDFMRAARLLRPIVREFGATLGGGRCLELWGLCAVEGAVAVDAREALTLALHAYQDEHEVAGMARCHLALGEYGLGRGELAQAAREYGYAHSLFARHGDARERVGTLGRLATCALHQERPEEALADADAALQLCRQLAAPAPVEAEARLVRAQTFTALGQPQAAARELLWAERLVEGGAPLTLHLALVRAESLLALGYPRRAATVLARARAQTEDAAPLTPQLLAHAQRLEGEATLGDAPARAASALEGAHQRFTALRQPYFRSACELALVRALHRLGSPEAQTRLDALASARLQRWPRLAASLARAQEEFGRPSAQAAGAVRAPWTQAIGHHVGRVQPVEEAPASAGTAEVTSLFGRLQSAWGRLRSGAEAS